MKKIITLIILLANLIGKAQCPAPSNLTISIPNATSAQLNWIENGTATAWEVAVVPDFYLGSPIPLNGIIATSSSYLITGLPPAYGCYAFFVRSVCSATVVSPWAAVGSSGCSTNVFNYLVTLSNDSFSFNENNGLQLFPNPTKNIIQLKINTKIDKITIFDSLGKAVLIQTRNNNEVDLENLSKGIYLIEVLTEVEKIYKKFIKE